jgi:CHASE2 domain-containing sensor protein
VSATPSKRHLAARSASEAIVVVTLAFLAQRLLFELRPIRAAVDAGLDAYMQWGTAGTSQHTTVVIIDDVAKARYFAHRRPVPPDSLLAIVDSLRKLQPQVLVVDVFTDDEAYRAPPAARIDWPEVVWATSPDTAHARGSSAVNGWVRPALGGRRDMQVTSGIAALLTGTDQILREARVHYDYDLTLPVVAARMFKDCHEKSCVPEEPTYLIRRYQRPAHQLTLGEVLEHSMAPYVTEAIANKIVVLGFAEDLAQTADGRRLGSEIVADAIETLVRRDLVHHFPWWADYLIGVVLAFVGITVVRRFREDERAETLVTAAIIIVFCSIAVPLLLFQHMLLSVVMATFAVVLERFIAPFVRPYMLGHPAPHEVLKPVPAAVPTTAKPQKSRNHDARR